MPFALHHTERSETNTNKCINSKKKKWCNKIKSNTKLKQTRVGSKKEPTVKGNTRKNLQTNFKNCTLIKVGTKELTNCTTARPIRQSDIKSDGDWPRGQVTANANRKADPSN